ncbi:MAG TPA: FkbM family methyltransferase, partial [Rhabdochlamydiaceae bacterium]
MKLFISILFLLSSVAIEASYQSQHGQDRFIHENFFPEKKEGTFVEIGAYDGTTFSNTYFFEKKLGWKGLCIEPNPQAFNRLKNNRDAICVQGCISEKPGTVKFLQLSGYCEMLSGIQNKYDPEHVKRIDTELASHGGAKTEIEVPAFTLNALALKHGIGRIDYLSIDTEGGEWDILNSIDCTTLDIDVISVENNYGDQKIKEFLFSKGYAFIQTLDCDEIYKKKRFETFTSRQRPSLAFIQQFLPENPVIVEAGSHIGSDTAVMSKRWGKGLIYAFEPSPDVYKQLKKKCRKRKNVKTFQLALGKEQGVAKFYPSKSTSQEGNGPHDAQGSLLPPSKKEWAWPSIGFGSSISVKQTTLDAWAKREGIRKIDFLWLDMQ